MLLFHKIGRGVPRIDEEGRVAVRVEMVTNLKESATIDGRSLIVER